MAKLNGIMLYTYWLLYNNPGMEFGGAEEVCADSFHSHLKQEK
jgi:hypothetical protein